MVEGCGRKTPVLLRILSVLLLLAFSPAARPDGVPDRDDSLLRDIEMHARFLGSPEIGDARPGTEGLAVVGRYLAVEARRLGLRGLGRGQSYLFPFDVTFQTTADGCRAEVLREGATHVLDRGADFVPLPDSAEGEATGAVLLLKMGMPSGDLSGKLVVLLDGPDRRAKLDAAEKAGAAAAIIVADPRVASPDEVTFRDGRVERGRIEDLGTLFVFTPASGGKTRRLLPADLAEIRFGVPPGPVVTARASLLPAKRLGMPAASISVRAAETLLGRPLADVLDEDGPAPEGAAELRLRVVFDTEKRSQRNVAAFLPGGKSAGPAGAVVISAPYDGNRPDRGAVVLLGIAAELAGGPRPPRSVVFLFRSAGKPGSAAAENRIVRGMRPLAATVSVAADPLPGIRAKARGEVAVAGLEAALLATGVGAETTAPILMGVKVPGVSIRVGDSNPVTLRAAARLGAELARSFAAIPTAAALPAAKPPVPEPVPEVEPTLEAVRKARFEGRLDAALRAVDRAIDASPGRAELYLERGRILIGKKDLGAALEDAANLEKLHPEDGRSDLLRAEAWLRSGKEENGRQALNRAAGKGLPDALLARAALRLSTGADDAIAARQVLDDLRAAFAKGGESAVVLCARGMLAGLSNRADLAIDQLTRAIAADPYLGLAHQHRAAALIRRDGDSGMAVRDCTRAMELGLTDKSLWFNRGLCRLKLGLYTLSIRDFEAYLLLDPGSSTAIYNIACAQALMGNREEALRWLSRSVAAGFNDPGHARADPDLESIRDDPRFEGIIRSNRTD